MKLKMIEIFMQVFFYLILQTNILTKRIQKLLIYIEYQLKLIACHRNLNW